MHFLTHSWEDKGVRICPKVNVMVRLHFELAYYDSAVQLLNYYITRTPPTDLKVKAMKSYATCTGAPELESHQQMLFSRSTGTPHSSESYLSAKYTFGVL